MKIKIVTLKKIILIQESEQAKIWNKVSYTNLGKSWKQCFSNLRSLCTQDMITTEIIAFCRIDAAARTIVRNENTLYIESNVFPLSYMYSIISLQKNNTKVLRIDTTFLHNYLLIMLVPNTFSKKKILYLLPVCQLFIHSNLFFWKDKGD